MGCAFLGAAIMFTIVQVDARSSTRRGSFDSVAAAEAFSEGGSASAFGALVGYPLGMAIAWAISQSRASNPPPATRRKELPGVSQSIAKDEPSQHALSDAASPRFCTSCGERLGGSTPRFCTSCGEAVQHPPS
jgi:membrane protease subunit (stomatin/prohibitin family)